MSADFHKSSQTGLDLKRHRLRKFVAAVLENGEFKTLYIDFEKIHRSDLIDIVEMMGLHRDFACDATVVAEGDELL
jgi:hypothetical protein